MDPFNGFQIVAVPILPPPLSFRTSKRTLPDSRSPNTGASIITNTILGVPHYSYGTIMYPKTLF